VSKNSSDEEETPEIRELRRTIARTQKHLSSLVQVLDQRESGKDVHKDIPIAE
jgi:hypothetical protein